MSNSNPLSDNDVRQCLRVACGATLGFLIAKIFNCSFGVFYLIMPILLLGVVPTINAHVIRQVLAAAVVCGIEVGILGGMFGTHPGLMIPVVFLLFVYRFIGMAKGSLFLFGIVSVINLSVMLHFASYPTTDLSGLIMSNFWACALSILIALLMVYIFPDTEPRPSRPVVEKPGHRIRHEVLLGSIMATLSFVVFQMFDLEDSLSAQSTSILLLFPMHWNGALDYAKKRVKGTIIGVLYGVSVQLILYDWSATLILVTPLVWIGFLIFSRAHVKEGVGSGVGFGSMTTMAVLFGQYLAPGQDLLFSSLYRISCVCIAVFLTLCVLYLVHRLLNQFEATHFGQ